MTSRIPPLDDELEPRSGWRRWADGNGPRIVVILLVVAQLAVLAFAYSIAGDLASRKAVRDRQYERTQQQIDDLERRVRELERRAGVPAPTHGSAAPTSSVLTPMSPAPHEGSGSTGHTTSSHRTGTTRPEAPATRPSSPTPSPSASPTGSGDNGDDSGLLCRLLPGLGCIL